MSSAVSITYISLDLHYFPPVVKQTSIVFLPNMKIIFLSFMTGLICAYPSEISLGTSEDNLFPISDPAIFGDDTLVSSIGSSNYESKEPSTSNNFDIEGSIDSPNFLTEDSSTKDLNFDTLDPSLASISEKPSENLSYQHF